MGRFLRDLSRPTRHAALTLWWLLRSAQHRLNAVGLFGRLWLREWRHRTGGLELLSLDDVELWVGEFNDLKVCREVFGDQVYKLPPSVEPRVVLDCGANIGASVLWFASRYPDAMIHAVEPDRRSLEKLRRNVGHLSNVTIHAVAVGAVDGRQTFWEAERGWSSSLYVETGQPNVVAVVSLPTLLAAAGVGRVDVLKLDIEGAEWPIFSALRLAEFADVVAGEMHQGMGNPESWRSGLAGFDVRFERREGSGHFTAVRDR